METALPGRLPSTAPSLRKSYQVLILKRVCGCDPADSAPFEYHEWNIVRTTTVTADNAEAAIREVFQEHFFDELIARFQQKRPQLRQELVGQIATWADQRAEAAIRDPGPRRHLALVKAWKPPGPFAA